MEKLEALFANAAKINQSKDVFFTPKEWDSKREYNGVKRFKRAALGLCGDSTVKTLDQMAQLLYKTGVVSSIKEGEEIVPNLVGKSFYYCDYRSIEFSQVENATGQKAYKIYVRWDIID